MAVFARRLLRARRAISKVVVGQVDLSERCLHYSSKGGIWDFFRSRKNLIDAWNHVQKSALNSKNKDIRAAAVSFSGGFPGNVEYIGKKLRAGTFNFQASTGIAARKDRSKPKGQGNVRPITVPHLETRIVQRALLQALQHPNSCQRTFNLRKLDLVNQSNIGIGGLAGQELGGVTTAAKTIMTALDAGFRHYWRTDIKNFFSAIPKTFVKDFVKTAVCSERFSDLFSAALDVGLVNEGSLTKQELELFPNPVTGVPQGSSLSSLCGNICLYQLDHEVSKKNVTIIRYVDDVIIFARSSTDLKVAKLAYTNGLEALGFTVHQPNENNGKAAEGVAGDNHVLFVGYEFQPKRMRPKTESFRTLKSKIEQTFKKSEQQLIQKRDENNGVFSSLSVPSTVHKVNNTIISWENSYSITENEFATVRTLDEKIEGLYLNYLRKCLRLPPNHSVDLAVFGRPMIARNIHVLSSQHNGNIAHWR